MMSRYIEVHISNLHSKHKSQEKKQRVYVDFMPLGKPYDTAHRVLNVINNMYVSVTCLRIKELECMFQDR